MAFHVEKVYTYVLTYTISNEDVAKDYLDFLKLEKKDGGLEVGEPFDQSTYGTTLAIQPIVLLHRLRNKLEELYRKYKVSQNERKDDKAKLVCPASYYNNYNPTQLLLFDIFDFE